MNIPSKFIDGKDGRTMWLCYAAKEKVNKGGCHVGISEIAVF